MFSDLKPYPEYKDSGVPWLDELPAEWRPLRAKCAFHEIDERSEQGNEELLSVSHKTGVTPRSQKNITMFMAESYKGHKVCRSGDIVVNTMWAWMAALGVSQHVGIVSPAYGVYRPRDPIRFEPKYLDYLLRTALYRAEYVRRSRGITTSRLRLYPPDFLGIPFIQPPIDEQRLIIRFLDWHGAQTANLIRAKKKTIALLNEQKQAIIHGAVTRGLVPNAKLKPSGIPWLGDVPEGWELKPLRFLGSKFGSAVTPRGGASVYQPTGIPFLRSQNVHFDGLRLDSAAYISQALHDGMRSTHVRPNDVLLNITGASIGRVCAVPEDFGQANVSQHVCIIRPRTSLVSPMYLASYLSTDFIQRQIRFEQNGASREGLNLSSIRSMVVLLPPPEKQKEICDYIAGEAQGIMATIKMVEKKIALIQELRMRLLADVVTGKLDVRDAALNLSETLGLDPSDDVPEDELDEESEELAEEAI